MLKFLALLIFVYCTASTELKGLELLYSGKSSDYFVSDESADVIKAAETCAEMGKNLKLLSIENEEEFIAIRKVLNDRGIESVWTSGLQTISNQSTKYIWTGTSMPISYINFADILRLNRFRRALSGGYYPVAPPSGQHPTFPPYNPTHPPYGHYPTFPPPGDCTCDEYCPVPPTCEEPDCTITVKECTIDQPYCNAEQIPPCQILDPQPHCTVTCEPCTITRGTCKVTRGKCEVKHPPKCTTVRGNCTLNQPICTVEKGKCTLVHQPCQVQKPPPCEKPPTCSFKPKCSSFPPFPNYPEEPISKPCTGSQCPLTQYPPPCQGSSCPTSPKPCHGSNCKCEQVFHCIPDKVCIAPPVICPPAIYHCLPEKVHCQPETLVCKDQETTCDPPEVYCPPYQKECTQDIIVCPAPKTVCTPAVSHCASPNITCTQPGVYCPKPHVHCNKLPDCEVPPPCFNSSSYGQGNQNSQCTDYCKKSHLRSKRSLSDGDVGGRSQVELLEPEELLSAQCISLKKAFGFKWTLEACEQKNRFICEGKNK